MGIWINIWICADSNTLFYHFHKNLWLILIWTFAIPINIAIEIVWLTFMSFIINTCRRDMYDCFIITQTTWVTDKCIFMGNFKHMCSTISMTFIEEIPVSLSVKTILHTLINYPYIYKWNMKHLVEKYEYIWNLLNNIYTSS